MERVVSVSHKPNIDREETLEEWVRAEVAASRCSWCVESRTAVR
jgi:hypothetical protein